MWTTLNRMKSVAHMTFLNLTKSAESRSDGKYIYCIVKTYPFLPSLVLCFELFTNHDEEGKMTVQIRLAPNPIGSLYNQVQ